MTLNPRSRSKSRGQSLVEFAILAPVFLAVMAICIDFARVYQGWINLESATRDAAQYLATSSNDPLDDNWSGTDADKKARYLLETSTGATFEISSSQASCSTAKVSTTFSTSTSSADGGSNAYPVGTAKVSACLPFRPLFAYPVLTNGGDWIVRSERTYRVMVGR
jgi:Flp pilus assembly protein TadG